MKELTIKQKAEAYEKVLGRAKELYSKGTPGSHYLEKMFPELNEDES